MLIGISVLWKGLTGFKLIVFDWDGIRKPGSWPTSVWPSRIWVSNRPAMRLHVISLNLASSKPWPGFNPRPATRSWAESPTTIGFTTSAPMQICWPCRCRRRHLCGQGEPDRFHRHAYDAFGFRRGLPRTGFERRLLTVGRNKRILDPFSPLHEEQRASLQGASTISSFGSSSRSSARGGVMSPSNGLSVEW